MFYNFFVTFAENQRNAGFILPLVANGREQVALYLKEFYNDEWLEIHPASHHPPADAAILTIQNILDYKGDGKNET